MRKLIANKNQFRDYENEFKSIFQTKEIYEFIEENKIEFKEAIKYITEFKLYEKETNKYTLIFDDKQVLLQKKNNDILNEGIFYLDNPYFSETKNINDVDHENEFKRNIIGKYLEKPNKGLFLISDNGIGKTTLLIALANHHYLKKKIKTLYVFWPDFIEKTKRFEGNSYYFNKIKNSKRLIIDDLGQESISQWSRDDILHPLIAYRLEKKLTTYVSSNYLIPELQGIYSLKSIESKKVKGLLEKLTTLSDVNIIEGINYRRK